MTTDTEHLLQIARLCEELRASLETTRPNADDSTWSNYLDQVATVAAIWHHLEELNTADRSDDEPF